MLGSEIVKERMTTSNDDDMVVFLIGMRINRLLKVHKWLPVSLAMSRMLEELYEQPELGFIHHEQWFGRTAILVQYWRSLDQLMAYARMRDAQHLPAWADFNRRVGSNGDVGIWHETYAVSATAYESVYNNMPPFGLGKALGLVSASARRMSARGRLAQSDGRDDPFTQQPREEIAS